MPGENPLIARYQAIDELGREKFKAGAVVPFTGFPTILKDRANASVTYQPSSEADLVRHLIFPLRRAGRRASIGQALYGPRKRDYPIHTTLLEATLPVGQELNPQTLVERMRSDTKWSELEADLRGLPVRFNQFCVDGTNAILGAIDIPQAVVEARGYLVGVYTELGLKSMPLDIFHITLGRINELTEQSDLERFDHETREIRSKIADNSLTLFLGSQIRLGSSWDLIHRVETPNR